MVGQAIGGFQNTIRTSQDFNLGCHGHTVFGVAVRWKLAFSKWHGHVEDSMTVAPLSRQLKQA